MSAILIETAIRKKFRFATGRGMITTEDLWDLGLESLNTLAKEANRKVKESGEEDFLKVNTTNTEDKQRFEVLKYILDTKLKEQEVRASAATKKAELDRLVALKANKEEEALGKLSVEDIDARIAALKQ
jgi:hypothetical protein